MEINQEAALREGIMGSGREIEGGRERERCAKQKQKKRIKITYKFGKKNRKEEHQRDYNRVRDP